jgi:hypothetical protein
MGCMLRLDLLSVEKQKLIASLQCIMFFALQVDRGNLVQAVSDTLLTDLGLTTNGKFHLLTETWIHI